MKRGSAAALLLFSLCLAACAGPNPESRVRKPAVAGQFYPADGGTLASQMAAWLEDGPVIPVPGTIRGICVPHAGYIYSGATAAAAYRAVGRQQIDLVVVLAPSHRDYFTGATIYPGSAYATPLGEMQIDREAAADLVRSCADFSLSEQGHGAEHSLEVQLPFLQTLFPAARLLPVVIGAYDWPACERMGRALGRLLRGRRALVVASTDLYHGDSYTDCQASDAATIKAFLAMQPRALCRGLLAEQIQACGGAGVVVMQQALLESGPIEARLAAATNSNDVLQQRGGYVVGYAAALFYQTEGAMSKKTFTPLPLEAQIELLRLARQAIAHYLKHATLPVPQSSTPALQEKRGVFVTLTRDGELRGCIGMHETDQPLYKLVPDRAVAAAFSDPRFMPLRANELDRIFIQISVYLTNVYEASLEEFVMGRHGIILTKGNRGATYLPEVPLEAGWKTREEELASLCQKAGLPADAWKEGARIYLYETQKFDESLLRPGKP